MGRTVSLMGNLWTDETGAILSAELVLILTILVLGTIVGLAEVAKAVNTELNDVSNAIGRLDQSYFFAGYKSGTGGAKGISETAGARYTDGVDDCDLNGTCEIVCSGSNCNTPTNEGNQ